MVKVLDIDKNIYGDGDESESESVLVYIYQTLGNEHYINGNIIEAEYFCKLAIEILSKTDLKLDNNKIRDNKKLILSLCRKLSFINVSISVNQKLEFLDYVIQNCEAEEIPDVLNEIKLLNGIDNNNKDDSFKETQPQLLSQIDNNIDSVLTKYSLI